MPFKKVLIINTFGIGDVLFTTPIISNLKKYDPDIFIGYICNKRTFPVLENNPKVNKLYIYERDDFHALYQTSKKIFLKKAKSFFDDIKKDRYDLAIDISLNAYMGFLSASAGIKKRVGFNYKNRGRFLTDKVPLKGYEGRHIIEYYLDLLRKCGFPDDIKNMELVVDNKDMEWSERFLQNSGLQGRKPLVGLVPGGGASWGKEAFLKRWDVKNYAKLADYLIEKFNAGIILLGDKNDEVLCREIAQLMKFKAVSACGQTSIHQLAAIVKKCSLAVVNDGGPLHVAVASGVKTVSIFGPVDHYVYGPYPPEGHIVVTNDVACRPCYRNFRKASCDHLSCLHLITVDQVVRKVELLL